MLHGFRSSFRDWAADQTDHRREVIEAAQAHAVTNRAEAAFARSDLFECRRHLWVANYYSARNPLRLSSLVILGVVARMFRCATRSSCWCT